MWPAFRTVPRKADKGAKSSKIARKARWVHSRGGGLQGYKRFLYWKRILTHCRTCGRERRHVGTSDGGSTHFGNLERDCESKEERFLRMRTCKGKEGSGQSQAWGRSGASSVSRKSTLQVVKDLKLQR